MKVCILKAINCIICISFLERFVDFVITYIHCHNCLSGYRPISYEISVQIPLKSFQSIPVARAVTYITTRHVQLQLTVITISIHHYSPNWIIEGYLMAIDSET